MKRMMIIFGAVMAWTAPAIAAGGTETTGISLIIILLLGFRALLVVGQLIPGLIIFCGIVRGLFRKTARKSLYRFYPTCSEYAFTAIRRHGPLKGLFFSARRFFGYFG